MVSLGKPRERSYQFALMDVDGITMYRNRVFGEKVKFQVSLSSFLFFKALRIDPLPGNRREDYELPKE